MDRKIHVPHFNEINGFHTDPSRSALMSKIRGRDNKSERLFRKALWGLGIRFRKNDPRLIGKPDITIQKFRLAIFIDGEFWHGFNWNEKKNALKTNRGYWIPKIERNIERDRYINEALVEQGWQVIRFWEKEVKHHFGSCLTTVLREIEWRDILGTPSHSSKLKCKSPSRPKRNQR
jgi:DNA mismatch endonuclease, patch repair protein